MGGLPVPALLLLALCYNGLVLFTLAQAVRRLLLPVRAAWVAFGVSAVVHGLAALAAEPERQVPLTLLWLVPHLLFLPLLLFAAHRQAGR